MFKTSEKVVNFITGAMESGRRERTVEETQDGVEI